MPLVKNYLKNKNICKVTFSLPAEAVTESKKVTVLGDFNGWDPSEATPLKKQKDGSYKAIVELESGREYQFRYLLDGEKWENDWEADKYVAAEGSHDENSVVVL